MFIQINSIEELSIGTELVVSGTEDYIVSGSSDNEPSFDIKMSETEGSVDEFVGVIPSSEVTVDGLSTNVDLASEFSVLQDEEGRVTVVLIEQLPTDSFYNVYKAEVKKDVKFTSPKLESMKDMQTFDLTVKGSILQHAAKVEVINDFNNDEEVVTLIKTGQTGEPVIVYPKHGEDHAGGIVTAGDIQWEEEHKETIMKVLKKKKDIEAIVYESKNNTYKVRLGIEPEELEYILTGKKVESIQDVIERIHKEVGTPMATLENIHVYLKSQSIANNQVRDLLNMIRPYDDTVVDFIPQEPKTAYQDNKGLLNRAIAYMLGGESVLMSGDAATGKNLMAETLCWIVQKPYRFYSINIQTDKFDLTGRTVLQSQEQGGGTFVQDSFLVSMMKHGGAILLDEINASNPAVMTVLHSVVEKGHKMIDIESSDERVVAKEDFLLFGAMNPGYAGTGDLNEALHSRFATLNFGNNQDIRGLLNVHHESKDAPEEMLNQVNQLYTTLFENVREGNLDAKVLSFRRYAAAVNYASKGIISLKDALIDNVANMVLDPFENEIIVDAIDIHVG